MSALNQENDRVEVRAVVKGRVQGVGFRLTARNHAIRLGLVGSVRNLPDGSVEIYASGKRSSVDALIKAIKENAVAGHVSAVFMEEISPPNNHTEFLIL